MEIGNYGRLNFLGTTIIIENQRIISLINIKRQHFLNFNSHHPFCHKLGVIYDMVDRIIKLSSILSKKFRKCYSYFVK